MKTQASYRQLISATMFFSVHYCSGIGYLGDVSEDDVLSVEMWCLRCANKEL